MVTIQSHDKTKTKQNLNCVLFLFCLVVCPPWSVVSCRVLGDYIRAMHFAFPHFCVTYYYGFVGFRLQQQRQQQWQVHRVAFFIVSYYSILYNPNDFPPKCNVDISQLLLTRRLQLFHIPEAILTHVYPLQQQSCALRRRKCCLYPSTLHHHHHHHQHAVVVVVVVALVAVRCNRKQQMID